MQHGWDCSTCKSLRIWCLKPHYAFNVNKLQDTKSSLSCWLVAYNHTFTFMYFFPEIVVVPQSLEQLKKETITNQAHVCWHPRNLCFDFLNNARELLLRQALVALKESLSVVCRENVNKGGELNVLIYYWISSYFVNSSKCWESSSLERCDCRLSISFVRDELNFWAILVCIFKCIMGL